MEDELNKGEEEQKWLKKECDNISEILIKRNFELKEQQAKIIILETT